MGATFLRNNLNKRSVTLNLKDPEGVRLCLELAKTADIVCENFKAGTADRLGIGYDAVKAINPAIYLSVSGFGNDPGRRTSTGLPMQRWSRACRASMNTSGCRSGHRSSIRLGRSAISVPLCSA